MKTFLQKLTSRKFIAALAGIITGVGVIASGNATEGITAVIASVIAYLIAEGYIDAKAVDIADKVVEETKDRLEGGESPLTIHGQTLTEEQPSVSQKGC